MAKDEFADFDPYLGGSVRPHDRLLADEVELAVVVTDPNLPDNPIIYASEEFVRQTGYTAEDVEGRNCRFLQGPDTDPGAIELIRLGLRLRTTFSVDLVNYRKNGEVYLNRLRIRPLFDDAGALTHYVGAQNPI